MLHPFQVAASWVGEIVGANGMGPPTQPSVEVVGAVERGSVSASIGIPVGEEMPPNVLGYGLCLTDEARCRKGMRRLVETSDAALAPGEAAIGLEKVSCPFASRHRGPNVVSLTIDQFDHFIIERNPG